MRLTVDGFKLITKLDNQQGLLYLPVEASLSITKGDALFDNGAGYITTLTAFAATFVGVAAGPADNSSGAAGDITVPIIPPHPYYRFWVKNESATVIAQTDIGEIVDLESADGIDVTDVSTTAWGFRIDEIDISTLALAANAGGFAIGRFITV